MIGRLCEFFRSNPCWCVVGAVVFVAILEEALIASFFVLAVALAIAPFYLIYLLIRRLINRR